MNSETVQFNPFFDQWAVHLYLLDESVSGIRGFWGIRVATVREKYLENDFFSRSGKSQGILWMVREI